MSYVEAGRKHVKEILKFFKKIGFKDVDGGDNFFMGGKQLDACAGHESTLLIIECTTQRDINSKINTFRGKINDISHGFRQHKRYKSYKKHILILAVKRQKVTDTLRDYGLKSKGRKIYIWDNDFVSYYSSLLATIGKYAKYNLLAEINVKPDLDEHITVPAFLTIVGRKKGYMLFLFFVEAKDLLKIAYVARRELGFESFYQRMIKKSRLREIAKKYIEKGRVFPNSIVVALERGSWDFEPISEKLIIQSKLKLPNWLNIVKLTLVNSYRSCWIIDGQHRLYSYVHTSVPGFLGVSAFARINKEKEAQYFLDINREAKPVEPDLLWDLVGSLSQNSSKGVISNAVKSLREIKNGFFEKNIKIPSKGKGKFRFNNLCVTIEKNGLGEQLLPHLHKNKKNPFWNSDYRTFEKNLSQAVNQYFSCLNEGLEEEKSQVYSDGFVSVMISVFRLLVTHLDKKPSLDDERAFFESICEYINNRTDKEIEELRSFLTSEVNKKKFRDSILRLLQEKYDKNFAPGLVEKEESLANKIRDLEFQLNEFVNSILEREIGPNWMKDQKYFSDHAQRKECYKRAKLNNRPAWEFINFQTNVTNIIMGKDLWQSLFEDMFISIEHFSSKDQLQMLTQELWNYRSNMLGHKRSIPVIYSKDKENIIRSAYNIFISIIEKNKSRSS